jgi:predicted transcriptional regulator
MNLKSNRLGAGFSQLSLSLTTGVSRWRIGLAERGAIELRPDELKRIERAIEIATGRGFVNSKRAKASS